MRPGVIQAPCASCRCAPSEPLSGRAFIGPIQAMRSPTTAMAPGSTTPYGALAPGAMVASRAFTHSESQFSCIASPLPFELGLPDADNSPLQRTFDKAVQNAALRRTRAARFGMGRRGPPGNRRRRIHTRPEHWSPAAPSGLRKRLGRGAPGNAQPAFARLSARLCRGDGTPRHRGGQLLDLAYGDVPAGGGSRSGHHRDHRVPALRGNARSRVHVGRRVPLPPP